MNVAASGCASMAGFNSGSHGAPPPVKRSARASGSLGSGGVGAVVSLIAGSRSADRAGPTARVIKVGALCR